MKEKFQLSYEILGSYFNVWMQLYENLPLKLLSNLNTEDLITFCYVSKYFRKLVLKKFSRIFEISIGFCSVSKIGHM